MVHGFHPVSTAESISPLRRTARLMFLLDILDRIHHATLSGFPLMLVLLLCFFAGAFSAWVALTRDVRHLWTLARTQKPKEDARPDDDELADP